MESPAQTLVSARNPDTLHKAAIKSYCGCFFFFLDDVAGIFLLELFSRHENKLHDFVEKLHS